MHLKEADELLNHYLYSKNTDTIIEQPKTVPQETLEFESPKSMDTFSKKSPLDVGEKIYNCRN